MKEGQVDVACPRCRAEQSQCGHQQPCQQAGAAGGGGGEEGRREGEYNREMTELCGGFEMIIEGKGEIIF